MKTLDLIKQARENLKAHVQNRLPSGYKKCMIEMNKILNQAWDIAIMPKKCD